MNRLNTVFSVDDLTDSFWPTANPSPATEMGEGMNRSPSEWAFHTLMEETENLIGQSLPPIQSELSTSRPSQSDRNSEPDVLEIYDSETHKPSSTIGVDPDHCHAILKSKLDLACAAVARRVATVKPENLNAYAGNQKQPPTVGTQVLGPEALQTSPATSSKIAPSSGGQKKSEARGRQATSGSSRDDSDDDDLEGDTETAENGDLTDVKRARRMLSNRESARRSRQRKQEQTNELETQVGQLRAEHSTLLKRLSDMNHKYDSAAVDNRILKADIETFRTKVKMAEETVKQATGMNPMLLARPNTANMGLPFGVMPNSNHIRGASIPIITQTVPNQRHENTFTNSTLVPENMNSMAHTGADIMTKMPLPRQPSSADHISEQANHFTPQQWSHAVMKNKSQK